MAAELEKGSAVSNIVLVCVLEEFSVDPCLLNALAAYNRHQARTAALIMWRTGLRVSEVLELEWRDLDYSGASRRR